MLWLVIRDFNEIRCAEEKEGGAAWPYHQMARFNDLINFCGLMKLDFVGPNFTWLYQRGDGFQIRECLDRALVSLDWSTLFPMVQLFHKSSSVSDHCPLFLNFFEKPNRGGHKKGFRFEAMLVQDPRCESIVSLAWTKGLVDTSPYPIQIGRASCRERV